MTLESIKEEYKKSIKENHMDERDVEALKEEIDEAIDLDEFIEVVSLWAIPKGKENIERTILRRLITEK